MATHHHTINGRRLEPAAPAGGRRSLFAAASLLALTLATPALAIDSNPDAELLRLGAKMRVAGAHYDALPESVPDEDLDAAHAAVSCLVGQIEGIPARTLAGLLVKAEAIAWCRDGAECDPEMFGCSPYGRATTDVRLAVCIVRDLAAMQASGGQA